MSSFECHWGYISEFISLERSYLQMEPNEQTRRKRKGSTCITWPMIRDTRQTDDESHLKWWKSQNYPQLTGRILSFQMHRSFAMVITTDECSKNTNQVIVVSPDIMSAKIGILVEWTKRREIILCSAIESLSQNEVNWLWVRREREQKTIFIISVQSFVWIKKDLHSERHRLLIKSEYRKVKRWSEGQSKSSLLVIRERKHQLRFIRKPANTWHRSRVDSSIIDYGSIALTQKCYTDCHSMIRWLFGELVYHFHPTPRHHVWYWMTPLEMMTVVPPIDRQCLTCELNAIHRRETLVRKDNLPLGTSSFQFASLVVRRTVYLHTRQSIVHLGSVVGTSQCSLSLDGVNHRLSLLCYVFPFAQPLTVDRGVRYRSLA